MAIQTLEELKRQNEEDEAAQNNQEVLEESETEEVESEEFEEVEVSSDEQTEIEADEPEEVEAWLSAEEDSGEEDKSVPLQKHIDVRTKLKGSLRERDSEIEALKAENERLKAATQSNAVQSGGIGHRPKLEDFYDLDNPEEAYSDAMYNWRKKSEEFEQSAKAQEIAAERERERIGEAVNSHYQRAEQLIEKHGIDASIYQQADRKVRQAIDDVSQGSGDTIVDILIGKMDEGSEKVMFYVGSSQQRTDALKTALTTDPSGLKAMRLIGRWEAEAIAPKKKVTRAQKPAKRADGGSDTTAGTEAKLKKQYAAAHAKGNFNQSIKIREQARAAGFDPKNW